MELVNGRPESAAGRLEKELHTYDSCPVFGGVEAAGAEP